MAIKRPSEIGTQKLVPTFERSRHEGRKVMKNIEWKGNARPDALRNPCNKAHRFASNPTPIRRPLDKALDHSIGQEMTADTSLRAVVRAEAYRWLSRPKWVGRINWDL